MEFILIVDPLVSKFYWVSIQQIMQPTPNYSNSVDGVTTLNRIRDTTIQYKQVWSLLTYLDPLNFYDFVIVYLYISRRN